MSTLKVDQIFTTDDTPLFTTSSSQSWNTSTFPMAEEVSSGTVVQIQEHMYYSSNSYLYVTDTTPIPFAITPPDLISILSGSSVIINVSFQISTSSSSNYQQGNMPSGNGSTTGYSTYGGIIYINSTSAPRGNYVNGTMHEQTNDIPSFDESEIVHKEIIRFQERPGSVLYNLPCRIQTIDTPSSNFPVYTGYISRDPQIESLRSTGSFGMVLRWGIKFVLMEIQA
tara:strand:+ start:1457 stop:2134 length:678 start_codon:yes stop_codon:yes gene_type:complete